MPEWIGTILFLVAIGLTASKIVDDIGDRGLWGYVVLIFMIVVYAAAVGSAYVA